MTAKTTRSDLEITRPDGTPLVVDRACLTGGRAAVGPAVLDDHDIGSTLFVVAPDAVTLGLADILHAALEPVGEDLRVGVSALPGECGVWLRMLGDDTVAMHLATTTAWAAIRQVLTGKPAPCIRKT